VLLDRSEERATLDRAIEAASSGHSQALVLVGQAGMGKTHLLRYAAESAAALGRAWIAGVEAERDLSYAALHRIMRPLMPRLDRLPDPQRSALESAFGLSGVAPADRFLVGLACLTLLADSGSERGLVCVIDDAQWIDRESLEALAFVARRLDADRVALLFGVRDLSVVDGVFDGLPVLPIDGLPDNAALELLSASVDIPVEPDTARQIVAATSGCPLALIELATGLTHQQLQGSQGLGEVIPIGRQLEDHFHQMVRSLDADAQLFLLVAAAESSGDFSLVRRAAFQLGADDDAEDAAISSGLVVLHPTVAFRHPLIRAAVYSGASRAQRDKVHQALAHLIGSSDPDRQVRHLAAAAREPDPTLALELERAADRSARRGGYAAETSFLLQAVQLTPAQDDRGRRLLRAATAALNAGLPQRSQAILEQARSLLTDPLLQAEAMRLDGRLRVPLADPPSAPALLYEAASALRPLDLEVARDTFLEALEGCQIAGQFTAGIDPRTIARDALSAMPASHKRSRTANILLDGMAHLFLSDFNSAMWALRKASPTLRSGPVTRDQMSSWFNLGLVFANELCDDETYNAWVQRVETHARSDGALIVLQTVLLGRAKGETRAGQFMAAEMTYDEVVEITRLVGGPPEFYDLLKVDLYAWRGQETETRATAKVLRDAASVIGSASAVNIADLAVGTLELGMGRYAYALGAVAPMVDVNMPGWTCFALPIAIEAAARSGQQEVAEAYIELLRVRGEASGTNWALGQLARCRALLSNNGVETLHQEAIKWLASTSVVSELAQAYLGYGEWLRREGRQSEARVELRHAHDLFTSMGAQGFASRARSELLAAGDRVQRHRPDTQISLTAQEAHAARLAAGGATNAEIAARMFISANTVDYHLRKVYRKLGISSRRELAERLPALDE
jgi:DNA-binding CsgD family transcriptional regulator